MSLHLFYHICLFLIITILIHSTCPLHQGFREAFKRYSGSIELSKSTNTARISHRSNILRQLLCKSSSHTFELKDIVVIEPRFHSILLRLNFFASRRIIRPPRKPARVQIKITLSLDIPHLTNHRVVMVSGGGFCTDADFIRLKIFWLRWRIDNYPEETTIRNEEVSSSMHLSILNVTLSLFRLHSFEPEFSQPESIL